MIPDNIRDSQWGKKPVRIEGDRLRSIFDPWHPWQFYSPFEFFGRDREESLYMRFAALESNEDIRSFVNDFGFLGLQGISLRKIMIENDAEVEESLTEIKFQISRMHILLGLQQALTEKNLLKAKRSLLSLRSACKGRRRIFISGIIDPDNSHGYDDTIDAEGEWEVVKLDGYHAIVQEISHELQDVHQTLMYDFSTECYKGQWIVPTLLSAMYTMFSLDLQGGKILRKCQNTTCLKYFEVYANDTRKIYHDPSCAALQAQRNYRQKTKKKKEEASQTSSAGED
ncbi:hypothetical protein SBF1_1470005 [Candidatus Desulfosporosinus infrequens]|uniref:Zinc finger CGNR domain-containing protein n=1 Tax=Candidatus Desulfosporosinus infrequens TaxID=2043169 RepID=A0A2U3K6G2_9FIRM|nr:hypothetical protein SBF1_1470005 [Candidatus Desulfosporosinus infrequens]